jgi:uncharacterized SAM-binding protein YcdF (DUF218 family)
MIEGVIRIAPSLLLRAFGKVAAAYGVLLFLVLHTPVTDWFAYPLLPPMDAERSDAIVVLSAWATSAGELNESGLRRTLTGGRLYKRGMAPVIVVTGRRARAAEEEGDALRASAELLEDLGVPAAAITIEDRSDNTHESAINVAAMARARRWWRVTLVTDAFHMQRARKAFEREGLQVFSAPTMLWQVGGERPSIRLAKLDSVLHEYGGLAYYWARGWL